MRTINIPKMPTNLKKWYISQSHNTPSSNAYKEWSSREQSECFEVARAEGYQDGAEDLYDRVAVSAAKNFDALHSLIHDAAFEISIGKLGKAKDLMLKADQLSHAMIADPSGSHQDDMAADKVENGEVEILRKMGDMCVQSLSPNLYEAFGEIVIALKQSRRALKETA